MKKLISVVLLAGFVCAGSLAYGQDARSLWGRGRVPQGLYRAIDGMFRIVSRYESDRIGPLYNKIRGSSAITNTVTPYVRFTYPTDGQTISGNGIVLRAFVANWVIDPSKAVSAGTQFANGTRERNTGHTHVWIYDPQGNEVKFTGASGLLPCGVNEVASAPFNLPPGTYKAYVTLQNHDHTVAIPGGARTLPPINTVLFTVQ